MIKIYRLVYSLLDEQERRQFWTLTLVMAVMALFEVVGISAVLLLLNILAEPSTIHSNATLQLIYTQLGFTSDFGFMVATAAGVMLFVLLGLAIKAGGTYAGIRYATMRGFTVSSRMMASYLSQPYAWFLSRNSADIAKNVLVEVDGVVNRVIAPALRLLASSLMAIAIVALLLVVDAAITVLSAGLLTVSYSVVYLFLRGRLRRKGEELMLAFGERFRIAQESLGGIKDVKLLGLEDSYVDAYQKAARRAARSQAAIGVASEVPRFALEAISFGTLLALILLLLMRSGGNMIEIVPVLGVVAFSVMRLLPALQQIYNALASIWGARAILESLAADHAAAVPPPAGQIPDALPLPLNEALELSGIHFSYELAGRAALRGVDMRIAARTTVGIVGGTGAGKTTLVDLALGLLRPNSGEIRVDGTVVTPDNLRAWQRSIGYVPQTIFLTDDTVASNIAFGIPKDSIDMAAVVSAARAAALHEFVVTELPQGYQTLVGERGVRLSGGQRQRIGIARALYRNPTLLIMDEATSALDNITERVVMEAVHNIRTDKTIILIAHRLSTVQSCDTIFLMEQGRVAAQGSYDELVKGNETFRKMAVGA